ncbi:MAG: MotA/TolQ/ExbB proton channel family protein [bacterium]|nr:MotA/TolQ/ExbB proton channel family protein [bacterium]
MQIILTWINSGGIISYILILCSICSISFIINRLIFFYLKSRISVESFISKMENFYEKKDIDSILSLCDFLVLSPFSSIAAAIFKNKDRSHKTIMKIAEKELNKNIKDLERYIIVIGTIANVSVYIGLLGTILGIMQAFTNISLQGMGGIEVVIGGVSKALVTTAFGLFVAIPAVVFYNYLTNRVENFINDMELLIDETLILVGKET